MENPDTTADGTRAREIAAGGPLQVQSGGAGPDLVLVHGWSMNSAVWAPVLSALEAAFRVHRVDLPGHGLNRAVMPGVDWDRWVEAVLAAAPERAVWLGWSLGGMLALAAAAHKPPRVERLILVAANPRFVASEDWPTAVETGVWDTFINGFRSEPGRAVKQFTRLQALGGESPVALARRLDRAREQGGAPSQEGLAAGLDLLASVDLRDALRSVKCPLRFVLGAGDALIPDSVGPALAALNPRTDIVRIDDAGHAPFFSRPGAFLEAIGEAKPS